jgi:hypothetical protein
MPYISLNKGKERLLENEAMHVPEVLHRGADGCLGSAFHCSRLTPVASHTHYFRVMYTRMASRQLKRNPQQVTDL